MLGFAIALMLSLSILNGFMMNSKEHQEANLQQITYAAGYMSATHESPHGNIAWGHVAGYGTAVTVHLVEGAITFGWCPAGWICAGAAIVTAG